jgi:hypothetical protein
MVFLLVHSFLAIPKDCKCINLAWYSSRHLEQEELQYAGNLLGIPAEENLTQSGAQDQMQN